MSEDGSGGACADGNALRGAHGVAVSPKGEHVYVASFSSGSVAVFARDKKTGVLTQLAGTDGCVSQSGATLGCAAGEGLDGAFGVAVSPDGKNVYVVSVFGNSLAVLIRDKKTGVLTQPAGTDGCVSDDGSGGACADGEALDRPVRVAVSPDGKHVYVASEDSDALAIFARDKKTGLLTQLPGTDGCVSNDGSGGACTDGRAIGGPIGVTVSPDGKSVYLASTESSVQAVDSLARDKKTGVVTQLAGTDGCVKSFAGTDGCAVGVAMASPTSVAVNRKGLNLYMASDFGNGLVIFARDKKTGALTQLPGTDACVSRSWGGTCADGEALDRAIRVAVSNDGKNVYVLSASIPAVAVFARDKKTGAVNQLAGTDACVSADGSAGACADGEGLLVYGNDMALSRDGKNLYVVTSDSGLGAVAVFARQKK